MSAVDYETALGFVISLRPRMAVEDADAAARRLMNGGDSLAVAIESKDFVRAALLMPVVLDNIREGKKIQAIKELRQVIMQRWGTAPTGGSWLREAKDAVEDPRVVEATR